MRRWIFLFLSIIFPNPTESYHIPAEFFHFLPKKSDKKWKFFPAVSSGIPHQH
jgi:hypothetical protein